MLGESQRLEHAGRRWLMARRAWRAHGRGTIVEALARVRRCRAPVLHPRPEVGGVMVVDDYGHHPAEIRATLVRRPRCIPGSAHCGGFSAASLHAHPKNMIDEFATAFNEADVLMVLTPIYAAGEAPIERVIDRARSIAMIEPSTGIEMFGKSRSVEDAQHRGGGRRCVAPKVIWFWHLAPVTLASSGRLVVSALEGRLQRSITKRHRKNAFLDLDRKSVSEGSDRSVFWDSHRTENSSKCPCHQIMRAA